MMKEEEIDGRSQGGNGTFAAVATTTAYEL